LDADLTVQGTETVEGDTTFEAVTTFGDGSGTDRVQFYAGTLLGGASPTYDEITVDTQTAAQSIVGNGTNLFTIGNAGGALTLSTTTSGALTVSSAGILDMDSVGSSSWTNSAGQLQLTTTTSGEIDITSAGAVDVNASGAVTVDATASTITLTTTLNNNIELVPGAGIINVTTTHANQALAMDTTASSAAAGVFVGDGAPVGTPNQGSLWIRTGATPNIGLYQYDSVGGWTQFTTSAGIDLQDAYDNSTSPATLTMASSKSVVFKTNESVGTESSFLVEQGTGGADYLLADAANDKLVLGSATIEVNSLNTLAFTGTNRIVTSDNAQLQLSTTTSGEIDITSAGAVDVNATGAVTVDGTTLALTGSSTATITSVGSSLWTNSTGQLQLTTTTSGEIDITSAGAVDINATNGVTIDAGATYDITLTANGAGGDINLTTESGGAIRIGNDTTEGAVTVEATTFAVNATGNVDIVGATASITTLSNGAIDLTPNGTGKIQLVATGSSVEINSSTASVMSLLTGTVSPNGSVTTGNPGSLFLQGTLAPSGALWIKQSSAGASVWERLATTTAITLQAAYENQIGSGANPVELDTEHFAITTDEANSAGFVVATSDPYTYIDASGGSLTLGQTNNLTIGMSGYINSGLTFTGGTEHIIQTASASGSALTISSAYNTSGGDIKIETTGGTQTATCLFDASAGDMIFTYAASGGATVTMTGSTGSFVVNNSALGTANISLQAGNDATLSTAAGDISISATGGTTTVSGSGGTNIGNAVNATVAINSGTAATTIDAGAGGVSIDAGASSNFSTTAGNLTLATTAATGQVIVNANGATAGAGVFLNATGTNGVITLESAVDMTFDARGMTTPITLNQSGNLDLVGFTATSIVGALNELKSETSPVVVTYNTAEANITAGTAMYMTTSGTVGISDEATSGKQRFLGVADNTQNTSGQPIRVTVSGEAVINSAISAGDEGKYVYLTTSGAFTTNSSAPTTTLLRVGIVSKSGAAGTAKIVVQVGEPVTL
jgi:hypothetical protein